jgi:hypothetical protein
MVHPGGGEPKTKPPVEALVAVSAMLNSGEVRYIPTDGTIAMKKAIIRYTEESYTGAELSQVAVVLDARVVEDGAGGIPLAAHLPEVVRGAVEYGCAPPEAFPIRHHSPFLRVPGGRGGALRSGRRTCLTQWHHP